MRRVRWLEAAALGAALLAPPAHARAPIDDPIVCQGCHGLAGEGRPQAGYPPIAGQPFIYLQRQLEAYADGRRPSRVMTPVAQWLSVEGRERIARHFASLAPPRPAEPTVAVLRVVAPPDRGQVLANVGDNARRLQACANCHGPGGRGQLPSGPYLAGLSEDYLRAELVAWRQGTRRSDPSGAMQVIARQLSDDDIAAVSAYYATAREP